MKQILFICVHNSGRSQMAQAFLEKMSREGIEARSAGTIPAASVNSVVVKSMKEKGIDISSNIPQLLTQDMVDEADYIFTMGCSIEEACPNNLFVTEDWELDDPHGQPISKVRMIRDQIQTKVSHLLYTLDENND